MRRSAKKPFTPKSTFFIVPIFMGILLSGCVSLNDPENSQEYKTDVIGTLSSDQVIGQTFTTNRSKLTEVSVWLNQTKPGDLLQVSFYRSPGDSNPWHTTIIPASEGENRISLPTKSDYSSRTFYLVLSANRGKLQVLGRGEDIYPFGSAYKNGSPVHAELAFRTRYAYDAAEVFSDISNLMKSWQAHVLVVIMIFAPGWLILDITKLRENFDSGEQAGLSIGLSLALIPLLMMWTTILKLDWTRNGVLAGTGAICGLLTWRIAPRLAKTWSNLRHKGIFPVRKKCFLSLLSIFLVTYFTRTAMVRDLVVPPWVDSIHHTLITKSILQSGGYPPDYLPHIPLEARHYHPGYHSILATFHWLSDLEVPNAMLFLGQGLNALSIFAVYLLTNTLVKSKLAGTAAAFITGLCSLMPAYYTSWGRYTQLTGLLVLPAVLSLLQHSTENNMKRTSLVLGGLTIAGLTMIHYRVVFFLGCYLFAAWIGKLYRPKASTQTELRSWISACFFAGVVGVGVIIPWIAPTLVEFVLPKAKLWGVGGAVKTEIHWRFFFGGLGIPALITAAIGLLDAIIKKRRFIIVILVWILLLFGFANPGYFHLPFPRGFINQTSVEIVLFLPISILAGYAISQVLEKTTGLISTAWIKPWIGFLLIIGSGTAILGAQRLLPAINPVTILFLERDTAAMDWIATNIPREEIIVVNPVEWGYGLFRGQDGGYWISAMTDRQTIPPNVLYGYNPEEANNINRFIEELILAGENTSKVGELMSEYGHKYIFIGSRGGLLSPDALQKDDIFEVSYHDGSTWIFKRKQETH